MLRHETFECRKAIFEKMESSKQLVQTERNKELKKRMLPILFASLDIDMCADAVIEFVIRKYDANQLVDYYRTLKKPIVACCRMIAQISIGVDLVSEWKYSDHEEGELGIFISTIIPGSGAFCAQCCDPTTRFKYELRPGDKIIAVGVVTTGVDTSLQGVTTFKQVADELIRPGGCKVRLKFRRTNTSPESRKTFQPVMDINRKDMSAAVRGGGSISIWDKANILKK
jgi:hypothetical protein